MHPPSLGVVFSTVRHHCRDGHAGEDCQSSLRPFPARDWSAGDCLSRWWRFTRGGSRRAIGTPVLLRFPDLCRLGLVEERDPISALCFSQIVVGQGTSRHPGSTGILSGCRQALVPLLHFLLPKVSGLVVVSSPVTVKACNSCGRLQAPQMELSPWMHAPPGLQVGAQTLLSQGRVLPTRGHSTSTCGLEGTSVVKASRRIPRANSWCKPSVLAAHEDLQTLEAGREHTLFPANKTGATSNTPCGLPQPKEGLYRDPQAHCRSDCATPVAPPDLVQECPARHPGGDLQVSPPGTDPG
eukprot:6490819-Amphidinium_carterae.2